MTFASETVALTLIGGVQHVDASGTRIRGESHLLLVGDPGKQLISVTISGTVDFSVSSYHQM